MLFTLIILQERFVVCRTRRRSEPTWVQWGSDFLKFTQTTLRRCRSMMGCMVNILESRRSVSYHWHYC